ncbi:MAG: hypothetical protein WKF37_12500 [Bryobacteraceae bacterium]
MLFRLGITAAVLTMGVVGQDVDHFEKKIRPVLASRCYSCHSSSLTVPQGGLILDSAAGIRGVTPALQSSPAIRIEA